MGGTLLHVRVLEFRKSFYRVVPNHVNSEDENQCLLLETKSSTSTRTRSPSI